MKGIGDLKVDDKRIFNLFCEVSRTISSTLDLPQVLDLLTTQAARALGARGSTVEILDGDRKRLEIKASYGLSKSYRSKGPIDKQDGLKIVLDGKPVAITDILSDPSVQYPKEASMEGLVSCLLVPMKIEKNVIGLLRIFTAERHEFTPEEIALAVAIANQGAVAIENARLYRQMMILNQIGRTIGSTLNLREVLNLIARCTAEAMMAKGASIRLLSHGRAQLDIRAAHGLSEEYLKKGPVEIKKSLIDQEVLRGVVVAVENAAGDERVQYPEEIAREGISSILCVPLLSQEEPVGVLRVYTASPHIFTTDEINFACTIAAQGAIAIRNAQLYQRLSILYEIGKMVNSTLDLREVLDLCTRLATEAMEAKGSLLRLLSKDRKKLNLHSSYGLSAEYLKKGPVEVSKSQVDQQVLRGQPVAIKRAYEDSRIQYPDEVRKEGIVSILSVPLLLNEIPIGVMRIYYGIEHDFPQEEIEFATSIADHGAIAIENARLFDGIKSDHNEFLRHNVFERRIPARRRHEERSERI